MPVPGGGTGAGAEPWGPRETGDEVVSQAEEGYFQGAGGGFWAEAAAGGGAEASAAGAEMGSKAEEDGTQL